MRQYIIENSHQIKEDVQRIYNFILSSLSNKHIIEFKPCLSFVKDSNYLHKDFFYANIRDKKNSTKRIRLIFFLNKENKWTCRLDLLAPTGPKDVDFVEKLFEFYMEMISFTKKFKTFISEKQ